MKQLSMVDTKHSYGCVHKVPDITCFLPLQPSSLALISLYSFRSSIVVHFSMLHRTYTLPPQTYTVNTKHFFELFYKESTVFIYHFYNTVDYSIRLLGITPRKSHRLKELCFKNSYLSNVRKFVAIPSLNLQFES